MALAATLLLSIPLMPVAVLLGSHRGRAGELRLADTDEWMERVRRGDFWGGSGGGSGGGSMRYSEPERPARPRRPISRAEPSTGKVPASLNRFGANGSSAFLRKGGTYRTVCVRLCDGYYWPVSFATTPARFAKDEQSCSRQCSSPAKLYVYRNPGAEPEEMTDLSGAPYSKLATAFLYRTEYKEDCECKPDPWSNEALMRHRVYALEERQRKGDKAARAELARLKSGGAAGSGSGGGRLDATSSTGPQDGKRR